VDDERVKGPKALVASTAIPNDARVSSDLLSVMGPGGHIARLPFTRREARNILALVPPAERFEAVDFLANRTTVTGDALRSFRMVHFATHGFLNNDYPELSGIVLSLVDEHGKSQDGFLRLHDLYNLRLPAELVTLSACQTALGQDMRGEGIVGLTRGLMYAGAARVLASLWKVDDAATAELMKRFYAGMLGPQRLSPAAALRAAQVSMREQRRWSAPYYWAAFVLQGEWR
jgi:CHAT domain-containing protein